MTENNIYAESIDKWNKNKGIGTISYATDIDIFQPVLIVLNKYFNKNPNSTVIIVIPSKSEIDTWSTKLTKGFDHYDKIASDNLLFLTIDSIIADNRQDKVELVIFHKIEHYSQGARLNVLAKEYIKFKYCLGITNNPDPDSDGFSIYTHCQVIHRVTKVDVITHGVLDGTVEYNVPSDMYEQDREKYDEYSLFIKDTLEIFDGDFDLIMKCYSGDNKRGISGDHYRTTLAAEKGWSSDIDTSITIYRDIDRFYNPNAIYERAKVFYDTIRKRNALLYNNSKKIEHIIKFIEKYQDKKVLIISKSSSFAKTISDSINSRIKGNDGLTKDKISLDLFTTKEPIDGFTVDTMQCVEYHPDIESRPLLDPNTNDYIRIQSGDNKGKLKMFGKTSLNKIANDRFNRGYHNVVSANNAIPKTGMFTIDCIIITSPECDTVDTFRYRLAKLDFKDNIKIINIFTSNSKESRLLETKQALTKNKIIQINDVNEILL